MTICDAFPEDSGSYSCVATFAEEPVITTMSLGVVGQWSHDEHVYTTCPRFIDLI